ncbi:MAG: hypothetical protein ABFD61_07635 [Chloroherpetonaceae bacterium]|jgi:hypothetical protein|nr:hypothetical protein [bacterium]
MFKQIFSWIIAIVVGVILIRVVLWLFSVVMQGFFWIVLIGLGLLIAYPLQKFLKEKIF